MPAKTHGLLFLCVANSSRSQMAEGLARSMVAPHVEVLSAGSAPTRVNPFAIQAMAELGLDIAGQRSTLVDEVPKDRVDTVVTLCAEEVCPVFLGEAERHHIPFEDPAAAEGSDEEKLAAFRRVRDQIQARLRDFLAAAPWNATSRPRRGARRKATATSNFGAGRRESHDATGFYQRFQAPVLDTSEDVTPSEVDGLCVQDDARFMTRHLAPGSVALVVTSPPYFAGKEYEQALGEGHIPASYLEYLAMLEAVFAECVTLLEPGGRIAVNVANLGRRPYRSLSGDITAIFERLGLLLRGEVIWRKAEGASGSCAWGSFRSPMNPVLRDVTERVVIASKGRFDRALPIKERAAQGLPHEGTLTSEEFMEATMDLWEIPPESARRVGHPAPFPVELPQRLIELYTFRGDLVLDPFMGAGTTLVAAARTGRRGAGFDMEAGYVALAERRLQDERGRLERARDQDGYQRLQARAVAEGKPARVLAEEAFQAAGFQVLERKKKLRGAGFVADLELEDQRGGRWIVDLSGALTVTHPGLRRSDAVLRALGRAHVWRALRGPEDPVLLLVGTELPEKGPLLAQLRAVGPEGFFDAVSLTSPVDLQRLALYAQRGWHEGPAPGFWRLTDLACER